MTKILSTIFLISILVLGVLGFWFFQIQTETSEKILSQQTSMFTIDPGVRAQYASNPLVIEQTDHFLTLAYEHRSNELKNSPQERVRLIETTDGVTFAELDAPGGPVSPVPVQLPDGTYMRYVFDPSAGGVVSKSSQDGVVFVQDEGLRYEADTNGENDPEVFGVWTYFVDADGGVVLLHNATIDNTIVVHRLYAQPESHGMTFELMEENILGGSLEDVHFADPHTIVRSNGDVWLIIMTQSRTEHPPMSRQGVLYAYVSRDGGESFQLHERVIGWDDFTEFDVYSLNDPKIVEFSDGTLRVYMAAMVKDVTMENGYRWDLVSVYQ